MAYYGNLALRPERKSQEAPQPAREREKVVRRRQLPIGEKLLYLFTVAVCVAVAGFIIFRYAEIYQMNRQIQEMNKRYEKTSVQLKEMQREVERLSSQEEIVKKATELGYVPLDPDQSIRIRDDGGAIAMITKK